MKATSTESRLTVTCIYGWGIYVPYKTGQNHDQHLQLYVGSYGKEKLECNTSYVVGTEIQTQHLSLPEHWNGKCLCFAKETKTPTSLHIKRIWLWSFRNIWCSPPNWFCMQQNGLNEYHKRVHVTYINLGLLPGWEMTWHMALKNQYFTAVFSKIIISLHGGLFWRSNISHQLCFIALLPT